MGCDHSGCVELDAFGASAVVDILNKVWFVVDIVLVRTRAFETGRVFRGYKVIGYEKRRADLNRRMQRIADIRATVASYTAADK